MAATSLGILLAYDTFYWPPVGRGWPDSFFITLILLGYRAVTLTARGDRRAHPGTGGPVS